MSVPRGSCGRALEEAWPPAGAFELLKWPLRTWLKERTAELRLIELEKYMSLVTDEHRYLAPVHDHDGTMRARVDAALTRPPAATEIEARPLPTKVPEELESLVRCLGLDGLVVDGFSVLTRRKTLPCYVCRTDTNNIQALWSGPARVPDEAIVGEYARAVGTRLVAQGVCAEVCYERKNSGMLHIDLCDAGGRSRRVLALSLQLRHCIQAVAYAPRSSGLIFCRGRLLATPSMQFLMAYGLAVDAPETAKGVRAALAWNARTGSEFCVILSPHAAQPAECSLESPSVVEQERAFLSAAVWPEEDARPPPADLQDTAEPFGQRQSRQLAEKRYGELRPRGGAVEDALSPHQFRKNLWNASVGDIEKWIKEAKTPSSSCSAEACETYLAPFLQGVLAPQVGADPSHGDDAPADSCGVNYPEICRRVREATAHVFGVDRAYDSVRGVERSRSHTAAPPADDALAVDFSLLNLGGES